MAESVDALVSNTSRFTPVPVRPRLWVLERETRVSLFFLSVLSGERVQHAVHRVYFVGYWQASLPRPTTHTQATPPLATLSLPISAVLTLICGCANMIIFIARPYGLRFMVFALVLRTSTPALGTEDPRRTTSTRVSSFQYLKNGHFWSPL